MNVLVIRAEDDAVATAARLRALQHAPILCPVIKIAATDALVPCGSFQAIAATSAHGPASVRGDALAGLIQLPLYTVGEQTARSARMRGFQRVISAQGDATALASLISAHHALPVCVLYLAARDRKPRLEALLHESGHTTVVVEVYEARAVEWLTEDQLRFVRDARIDAVLHYSRRSAEIFSRLVEKAGLAPHVRLLAHHCLSADVAEPLRAFGAASIRIAPRPDEDGLLATLSGSN